MRIKKIPKAKFANVIESFMNIMSKVETVVWIDWNVKESLTSALLKQAVTVR